MSLADWVVRVVERFGYAGVALLVAAENLLPPIPSEVVLPMAGFAVSRGTLTFAGVILAATVGSVGGAAVIYAVGRRVGPARVRAWMERRGRRLGVDGRDADRAQAWFDRHGAWTVLLGRLAPGVRSYVSLPAGFAHMPWPRFLLLTALGSAIWNLLLVSAGVALGAQWHRVEPYVEAGGWVVWTLLGLALLAFVVRRRRRANDRLSARRGERSS
ncbi:MAG TPA: DedA family protein [Candidatus Thermoplasmatota archaeon]|nr:DedA family protein [Candidatus Thermoplasmatota archaeon]